MEKARKKKFYFQKENLWISLIVFVNVLLFLLILTDNLDMFFYAYNLYHYRYLTRTLFTVVISIPWIVTAIMTRRVSFSILMILLNTYVVFMANRLDGFFWRLGVNFGIIYSGGISIAIWLLLSTIIAFVFHRMTEGRKKEKSRDVQKVSKLDLFHKKEITTSKEEPSPEETVKSFTSKREETPSSVQKSNPAFSKVDINRCGEEEFLQLPGMSLIAAKNAVHNRENQGEYQSLDDFVMRNNIKPHFMVQMESMIVISKTEKINTVPQMRRGRNLDL